MTDSDSTLETTLRLTKALGLARRGKMQSAQQLLSPADELPRSALELHALAALVTHDGDYERALRLWRTLLQKDPGNAEAQRMISLIEVWTSRPPWFRFLPLVGVLALVAALGAILFWGWPSPPPPRKPAPIVPPRVAAPPTPAPTPLTAPVVPAKNPRR